MQTLDIEKRVDTGALKIGSDWAGFFMRGDEARACASNLRLMAAALDGGINRPVIHATPVYLRQMADKLESCLE